MNLGRQSFSSALVAVAAAIVLLGTLYFASFRPGYSHIPNTISELGETGAPQAHWVAFGFFLPVGIIVWWALWLAQRHRSGSRDSSLALLALSGLGTGYVLAAFFPCDPGGPLFGSWRTLVHNAAGLIDYGGTALGFLLFCRHCARQQMRPQAVAFGIAAALGFFAMVLLALPPAFPVRGAVQRVTELIQFTGVFFVCRLLSTRAAPNTQPADSTVPGTSDRECLESWAHHRDAGSLQTLVERYLAFVHSSALRRTGDAAQAAEVTRAVFLVLGRRAHRLRKNTVLAGWHFQVTAVACRKLKRMGRLRRFWHWVFCKPRPALPPDATLWTRLAPQMDRALERLRTKHRNAVLLGAFLNHDFASGAKVLRTSERRVEKRIGRGIKKLANRLGKRRTPVDPAALASACATEGCTATVPEGLSLDVLQSMESSRDQRPSLKLARRTLNTLAWLRWRRRFVIGVLTVAALITIPGGIAVYIDSFSGYSRLRSERILWSMRFWGWWQVAEVARPWPTNATSRLDASALRNAQDLYRTTNIWHAHLRFTPEQWKELEFKRIGSMPNFDRPEGLIYLRNPKARRSGVAGVLGFEFDWTHADFEFGGVAFTNVGARVKGNVRSLSEPTRAYKVDLNKFAPGQKLGGRDELTFNSLLWDYSCLGEALGFEFFREAGVPAPRTAYTWLSASVTTQWEQKPLGLYLLVEAVDNEFAKERFGSKATPVFKPVTYKLFEHLGDEWPAYAPIYDLKTKATPEQQRRVIDFARLVSSATDVEFATRVGDFLDLDEFARFLAGEVLLPSYDGILADGQNFYMYLDPRSNKFGFIPWDLDSAWGRFWIASKAEQERASIWHPWIGENRFIERVLGVEEFRRIYRTHLEDFVGRLYVPDRLHRRIDEIAAVIHDPVAAQSALRLDKFEQAVGWKPVHRSPGEVRGTFNRPAHDMKRFINERAESVRRQLDGKSRGMILKYPENW